MTKAQKITENTDGKMKKKTFLSYDALRIISILAVILTHATSYFIRHYHFPDEEYTLSGIINGPVRFAVPVFVMITGALMLQETREDMAPVPFYRMYLVRFLIILASWLVIYAAYYHVLIPYIHGDEISWYAAVDMMLHAKEQAVALWYMYLVVGLYLMLPYLKLITKKANKKYIQAFVIIAIFVQFLPIFTNFLTKGTLLETTIFSSENCLTLFTGFTTYLLLGWYLSSFEIAKKNRIILYISGLTMLILHPILQYLIRPHTPDIRLSLVSALSLFELIPAAAIFLFVVQACGNKTSSHAIQWLGKATFGVFLIHYPILDAIQNVWFPYSGNHLYLYIFATSAACFVISLLIVYILQKVPFIRRIVT